MTIAMKTAELWSSFQQHFPFGDTDLLEREYEALVDNCISSIESTTDKAIFMDMLDLQWVVYVEQQWIIDGMIQKTNEDYVSKSDLAMARIQINQNIRHAHNLPDRKLRQMMFNMSPNQSVLDILCHRLGD